MKLSNKRNQGFTLIEIIIVIVILGILAAIALPKLTENIDRGRAAEAFSIGSSVAKAFDRCLSVETGGATPSSTNVGNCNSFAKINMATPPATNFTYSLASSGTTLTFGAVGAFTGAAAADSITFTFVGDTGVTTRTCGTAGKFDKMCK